MVLWINLNEFNQIKRQYKGLMRLRSSEEAVKIYDRSDKRLYADLITFIRISLIMTHRNAGLD